MTTPKPYLLQMRQHQSLVVTWTKELETDVNAIDLPKDFNLCPRISDFYLGDVPVPSITDYQTITPAVPAAGTDPGRPETIVTDRLAFNAHSVRYEQMLSKVRKTIRDRIADEDLRAIIQNEPSVKEGYAQVLRKVQVNAASQIDHLKNLLNNIKYLVSETPTQYLDRFNKVIHKLRQLNYPDRANATEVAAFELQAATWFIGGYADPDDRQRYSDQAFRYRGMTFSEIQNTINDEASKLEMLLENQALFAGTSSSSSRPPRAARANQYARQRDHDNGTSHPDPVKIFVGNLPFTATADQLTALFRQFGTVDEAIIPPLKNGRSQGFGFVRFHEPSGVAAALAYRGRLEMKGTDGTSRVVRIDQAQSRSGRASRAVEEKEENEQESSSHYSRPQSQSTFSILPVPSSKSSPSVQQKYDFDGIIDSGCSSGLTPHLSHVQENTQKRNPPIAYDTADGSVMEGSGLIGSFTGTDKEGHQLTLNNLHHVPTAAGPLVAVWDLLKENHDVLFDHRDMSCTIGQISPPSPDKIVYRSSGENGMFPIRLIRALHQPSAAANIARGIPTRRDYRLWHDRFMHAHLRQIKATQSAVHGLSIQGPPPTDFHCPPCIKGKMTRLPHPVAISKTPHKLGAISLDVLVMGEDDLSLGGSRYFLGFSVRHSGFKFGYALNRKAEIPEKILFAWRWLERVTGEKVQEFVLDREGTHNSNMLKNACEAAGVVLNFTNTDVHEQNGEIERYWRTVMDHVRSHMIDHDIPCGLWPEMILMAIHSHNRLVQNGASVTPYEKLLDRKPSVAGLRVPGCVAYARVETKKQDGKLGPRAEIGRFVGYGNQEGALKQHPGYLILLDDEDPDSIVLSRDVFFVENEFDPKHPSPLDSSIAITNYDTHVDADGFDLPHLPTSRALPQGEDLASERAATPEDDDDDDAPFFVDLRNQTGSTPLNIPIAPPPVLPEVDDAPFFIDLRNQTGATSSLTPAVNVNPQQTEIESRDFIDDLSSESDIRDQPFPTPDQTETIGSEVDEASEDELSFTDLAFDNAVVMDDLDDLRERIADVTAHMNDNNHNPPAYFTLHSVDPVEDSAQLESCYFVNDINLMRGVRTGRFLRRTVNQPKVRKAMARALLTKEGPRNLREALKDPKWREALQKEFDQMIGQNAWVLEPLPTGEKAIPMIWVLRIKVNEDTKEEKYKGRLCVDGTKQIKGVHYDATFTPNPSMNSFKFLMALRTKRNMITRQVDWVGAFLNAPIDKPVYCKQPTGFEVKGKEDLACKLLKAVYGTCQAPKMWGDMLDNFLVKDCGFERCPFEPRLYKKIIRPGKIIYLEVHTDDAVILADEGLETEVDDFVKFIASRFDITDLGRIRHYLGLRVQYDDTTTTLDQEAYLDTVLKEFLEQPLMKRRTPWDPSMDEAFDAEREPSAEDAAYLSSRNYWRLVGKLQYLVHTRPDISFPVGKLARFATNPRKVHWAAAQRVLAYLNGTPDMRLCFVKGTGELVLESYSDADYAGDKSTRKSTSGVVIRVGGTSVISISRRQPVTADSTTAAEVIALHLASKEVMWMRNMMEWVGYNQNRPTLMHCDNKAAIRFTQEGADRSKLKHLDVKYMVLREYTRDGKAVIEYVDTDSMVADINTKGLSWSAFERHRRAMGLMKGSVWEESHQSVNKE